MTAVAADAVVLVPPDDVVLAGGSGQAVDGVADADGGADDHDRAGVDWRVYAA